jgi:hypothetical protein
MAEQLLGARDAVQHGVAMGVQPGRRARPVLALL